jgi:hypothetical protein
MKTTKFKLPAKMLDCLTEDNLENFIEGLSQSLRSYMYLVKSIRDSAPKYFPELENVKNSKIFSNREFTYIDDGKQDNSVIIEVK